MINIFGRYDNESAKEISSKEVDRDEKGEIVEDGKLRLKQEELDVAKNRIQSGEVILSKEIVEEKKAMDVPVTHEEVVIERKSINSEPSDSPITNSETIRIPVSEEKVEIGKHTIVTGEVSAYKHEVEENKHVEETLKREEARINSTGDPNIVDKDTSHSFQ